MDTLNLEYLLHHPFPLVCLAGPTASGKSNLALKIAKKYNGVIINADSRQVYQGLPLLTAQPSLQDIQEVPHELYQYVPNKNPERTVMQWIVDVVQKVNECHRSGVLPILVGGSGFYIHALESGLSNIPLVPRIQEEDVLAKYPNHSLYEILEKVDKCSAKKIMIQDKQRILRALSIYFFTEKPLSFWQTFQKNTHLSQCLWYKIFIQVEKTLLKQRIQARFHLACSKGLYEEISNFPLIPDSPLSRSIGIKALKFSQHLGYFGVEAETMFLIETWRYAKRQRTWFQKYFIPNLTIQL
ncbi:tRNA (adenosine(37)-N6)-dimethylallyltransferase MiaA [Holospora obtusa]|nr:tRNA (adenosine(37)-N6)-dimethylallyltransferase MiaA [Holospora obtusa]